MSNTKKNDDLKSSAPEWKTFLFLTVCLFPILSVALIGVYGFSVWFLQMFLMGPPGH
ncbi:TorE protein [Psychromonas sp. CNPT3]|uniref:trimethylamine N-oxide reductase system protein TorE n=1 Tax=Psychromonas sp. CNPT3 TaxID=314282 RepID=UPI00006E7095|nr:trimethylamine N-oxide reductase system protein TorE [Psychromonas sp. CNPT3]AGH80071.1 TorE protein [Psychromonas sp. CNPT3]